MSFGKSSRILCILEILYKETDESHILTQPEIRNILSSSYSIQICRETFYHDIALLIDHNIPISTFRDNHRGYYIDSREFTMAEILYLIHSVYASAELSADLSRNFEKKILKNLSRHSASELRKEFLLKEPLKNEDTDIMKNLWDIYDARLNGQKIRFNYCHYDLNKNKEPSKQFEMVIPAALIRWQMNTYLVGKTERFDDYTIFRLDRMTDIKMEEKNFYTEDLIADPYDYAAKHLSMHAGKPITAVLRCKNLPNVNVMDKVIDEFGKNVVVAERTDAYFDIWVKATEDGILRIVQKYSELFFVVSPDTLRQKMISIIRENVKFYAL